MSIAWSHHETFKLILHSVSGNERLQLLQMTEGCDTTILHLAAFQLDPGIAEIILSSVNEEERYTLLSIQNSMCKLTPIHYACVNGETRVLDVMIRLTTEERWYKLLNIQDIHTRTPLHLSARIGHIKVIKTIANSITAEHLINLLRITDIDGYTPLQPFENCGKKEAAELLPDYLTKALLHVALKQTEEAGMDIKHYYQYTICLYCLILSFKYSTCNSTQAAPYTHARRNRFSLEKGQSGILRLHVGCANTKWTSAANLSPIPHGPG